MRSFLQLLVAIVATIKRAVYEPIANWWLSWAELWVSTSEESTKSVIRESFAVLVRVINGASAWFVSLFFDRSYYQRLRLQLTRPNPWSAWWDNDCNSTFNAIIERDCTGTTDTRAPIVGRCWEGYMVAPLCVVFINTNHNVTPHNYRANLLTPAAAAQAPPPHPTHPSIPIPSSHRQQAQRQQRFVSSSGGVGSCRGGCP